VPSPEEIDQGFYRSWILKFAARFSSERLNERVRVAERVNKEVHSPEIAYLTESLCRIGTNIEVVIAQREE
jgi:hypothetical protein